MNAPNIILAIVATGTIGASLVTAGLYAWDKRAAKRDRPRVPEKTLLAWSLVGGWPGGLVASRWLRHKTQKRSFRIRFVACCIVHGLAVAALIGWLFVGRAS